MTLKSSTFFPFNSGVRHTRGDNIGCMTRPNKSIESSRIVRAYGGCNVMVDFAKVELFRRWSRNVTTVGLGLDAVDGSVVKSFVVWLRCAFCAMIGRKIFLYRCDLSRMVRRARGRGVSLAK